MDTKPTIPPKTATEKELEAGHQGEKEKDLQPNHLINPGPPGPHASRTLHFLYHLHVLQFAALGPGLSNIFILYILPRLLTWARKQLPDEPIYRLLTPELDKLGWPAAILVVTPIMASGIWVCVRVLEPAVRRRGWALDQM